MGSAIGKFSSWLLVETFFSNNHRATHTLSSTLSTRPMLLLVESGMRLGLSELGVSRVAEI